MGYRVISVNAPSYDHTGWCEKTGSTCHKTLMKWVESLPLETLAYVRKDCNEAVAGMPEGRKASHYTDTALYCGQRESNR